MALRVYFNQYNPTWIPPFGSARLLNGIYSVRSRDTEYIIVSSTVRAREPWLTEPSAAHK